MIFPGIIFCISVVNLSVWKRCLPCSVHEHNSKTPQFFVERAHDGCLASFPGSPIGKRESLVSAE